MGAALNGLPRRVARHRQQGRAFVRLCAWSGLTMLLASCGIPGAPDVKLQEQSYQLVVVSEEAEEPVRLDGAMLRGSVTVELSTTEGVSRAAYYVGQPGLAVAPATAPGHASPLEGLTIALDTVVLDDGEHDLTAVVYRQDGGNEVISARFSVANRSVR